MRPRLHPPLLLAALLLLGCGAAERPPDLILITVDTLRADAVSAEDTPRMAELAAEGARFTHAYTPLPRTTPAVASLMTGLWPHHHGSREVGDPMLAGTPLAEVLSEHGYATLAASANAAANPAQNLDRGFDRFVGHDDLVARYGEHVTAYAVDVPEGAPTPAEALSAEALALVDEVSEDRPLFLWLLYLDPHMLYFPRRAWHRGLTGDDCLELYAHYLEHTEAAGQVFSNVGGVAERALPACRALYRAEVAAVDDAVGRLLDGLARRGRLDRAVVVLTADHGENLGEGGLYYEHGPNLHDAGLEVPLAVAGPGIEPGRVLTGAVSLVDLAPTLLSLLGIDPAARPPADGVDLSPLLLGEKPERRRARERVVFAESGSALWNEATDRVVTGRAGQRVCVNDPPWTLCHGPGGSPGPRRLYDHQADPALSTDLSAGHPDVVARLTAGFERWPAESGRLRAAVSAGFKWIEEPRFDGSRQGRLVDLAADPAETGDVSARRPELARRLAAALARWAEDVEPPRPVRSDEEEDTLRSLGYIR